MNEEHPVARVESSLVTLRERSTLVVIALAAVMTTRTADFALRQWSLGLLEEMPQHGPGPELTERLRVADALVNASSIAVLVAFVVTAFTFLMWTHGLVRTSDELGVKLALTPAQAVWSFIIPIVSLSRPYQLFTAAHAALDPEAVALPALRVDPSAQHDYRGVKFLAPLPVQKLPSALLGAWWAAFLVMCVGSNFLGRLTDPRSIAAVADAYRGSMFLGIVAVVAAALAITVVRGLTARVGERYRRIVASTPEELAVQGITLGSCP